MKLYLIFLLLIIPTALSQEITFFKQEYSPGETAQLKININIDLIQDLKNSQINILDSNNNRIPIQINLVKINKNLYLSYFNTPITPGEYKFHIKDLIYRENNILKTKTYTKNFIITQKKYEIIQIQPGALAYFQGDPTYKAIRITNLETSLISIPLFQTEEIIPTISLLQIPGRSSKTFYLRTIPEDIKNTGIFLFNLGNYEIPIYLTKPILVPKPPQEPTTNERDTIEPPQETPPSPEIPPEEPAPEPESPEECIPSWQCTSWSTCNTLTKIQTRNCVDINNCNARCYSLGCIEFQLCEIKITIPEETPQNKTIEQNRSITYELKKEIVFFSDSNNPQITVNSLINEEVPEKRELKGPLYIKNTGDTDLINLKITLIGNLDKIIRINITKIDLLKKGETIKQFIWINENKDPELDEYQGSMLIESEDFSTEFPIFLLISRKEIIEPSEETLFIEERTEKIDLEDFPTIEPEPIKEKELIEIIPPYKGIAGVLLLILLILIYYIFKRPSRKKTEFKELISKIEKK